MVLEKIEENIESHVLKEVVKVAKKEADNIGYEIKKIEVTDPTDNVGHIEITPSNINEGHMWCNYYRTERELVIVPRPYGKVLELAKKIRDGLYKEGDVFLDISVV